MVSYCCGPPLRQPLTFTIQNAEVALSCSITSVGKTPTATGLVLTFAEYRNKLADGNSKEFGGYHPVSKTPFHS